MNFSVRGKKASKVVYFVPEKEPPNVREMLPSVGAILPPEYFSNMVLMYLNFFIFEERNTAYVNSMMVVL